MPEWKTTVAPEVEARILAAADHREGDRVPIWDYIENPAVFDHFRRDGEGPHATMARVYSELGIDVCRGYAFPGQKTTADRHRGSSDQGEDAKRSLERELSDKGVGDDEWADFGAGLLREYREMRDNLAPRTMFVPAGGTGLTALYSSIGLERFCILLKDHPGLTGEVLRRRASANARWTRLVARERLCPLFFLGEDIGARDSLLFSPDWLRQHFIPAVRQTAEPLINVGVKVVFHSDGYLMEILDDLLDAGIDGLNPIEPLAGMDIAYLKRRYGDRLILVGNVDSSRLLPSGSVDDVRCAVRECIRAASQGGGHFIGSSGEVTPVVPLENVLAFYDACREFGRYPIQV